jgi:hypothetical protein
MDGLLDIVGWCPTKQIVTKQVGRNIITTLHGTNTSKAKERCNDDDEDIYITDDGGKAQMIMTIMNNGSKMPIPQLVLVSCLLSIGCHNFGMFKGVIS